MFKRVAYLTLALVALLPRLSQAQETPLSEILVRLIQADIRLAPVTTGVNHQAHFVPGIDQKLAPYLFNQSIISQLSTFPLGSSSGGFSYTFDPALGTYKRATESFGPAFAERALTVGRRKWSFGANYQHQTFSSFEGKNIHNGDIRFYLTHLPVGSFVEGDVIGTALSMDLKTDAFALFATYGVTHRLDVGVAVPLLHVSLDATIDANILRLATGTATTHQFVSGGTNAKYSDTGSASGVGDILLRAKYRLIEKGSAGLAAAVDLRAPTGDETNLLGTGATQAKIFLVASTTYNKLSPHANIGFTASAKSSNAFVNVTDEINYTAGTEYTVSPKLTIVGDMVGRQLRNSGRLVEQPRVFNWRTDNPPSGVTGSTTVTEFASQSGSLNLLLGSAGAKYNPTGSLLISANLLFPLTSAGIRSKPVPVIGFDYSF